MKKERYVEFDLLRALVIFSAFILRYNTNLSIGLLAKPSKFVHYDLFSVGGFFFFTSGYMARKVYLPKFVDDAIGTSGRMLSKGLKIFAIYLSYILIMRTFTDTAIPSSFMEFAFDHRFFVQVLFTFSLLFMFTPVILCLVSRYRKIAVLILIMMCMLVLFYDRGWPTSFWVRRMLIDRKLFPYPFIPALVIYSFGYVAGSLDGWLSQDRSSFRLAIVSMVLLCLHAIAIRIVPPYSALFRNRQYFTFVESVTPYLSLLIIRYMMAWEWIKKYLLRPSILCLGMSSLTFYVGSNILVGLLHLTKDSQTIYKFISIIAIGCISYLFTYWHANSSRYLASVHHRR